MSKDGTSADNKDPETQIGDIHDYTSLSVEEREIEKKLKNAAQLPDAAGGHPDILDELHRQVRDNTLWSSERLIFLLY